MSNREYFVWIAIIILSTINIILNCYILSRDIENKVEDNKEEVIMINEVKEI